MVLGGWNTHDDLNEAKTVLCSVKSDLSKQLGLSCADSADNCKVESCTYQVVAGMNFRVVFTCDGKKYAAVIYRDLSGNTSLTSAETL